jgi:hypothetical protein
VQKLRVAPGKQYPWSQALSLEHPDPKFEEQNPLEQLPAKPPQSASVLQV